MTDSTPQFFPVLAAIEPNLGRVRAYWEKLRRGDNALPFWDDVALHALGDLADDALLLDTFDDPLRFRFAIVGKRVQALYGRAVTGKFLDEVEQPPAFDHFNSQCRAAVEHQM